MRIKFLLFLSGLKEIKEKRHDKETQRHWQNLEAMLHKGPQNGSDLNVDKKNNIRKVLY